MARGHETRTSAQDRELQTQKLLVRLARTNAADERAELSTRIVELNLGLCDALVKRYVNRGADRDDLTQVARTALLLAIRRYRPESGSPFTAFATPTILGELRRHFRDSCWMVRPPRRIQELRARTRSRFHQLEQSLGRTPEKDDLLRDLGVDENELREGLWVDGSYRPLSLDAPVDAIEHDDTTLGSMLPDGDQPIDVLVDRLTLRRLVASLPRRDQLVVKLRFEDEWTQHAIGQRLGISQMQVSRILRRVLTQLKDELQAAERGEWRQPA